MRISPFARRLLSEWRRLELPEAESCVVLAVSGGADSMAMLLACDELRKAKRLTHNFVVAHLDHGLRGSQGALDARWVSGQANRYGFQFVTSRIDVNARVSVSRDNLEQAARRARYEFLADTARAQGAQFVLLAHTLDDQAETVLLRLLRGSGAAGLGGMRAIRPLSNAVIEGVAEAANGAASLVRPLLGWARRADIEEYCRERGQEFLKDAMNEDMRFARVRVRRQMLPLLRLFNPRVEQTLSRTATLLREDAAALDIIATELLREATVSGEAASHALDVRRVTQAPAALRRRVLRLWLGERRGDLRRIEAVHIRAVESLLKGERGGRVIELPGGGRVERRGKSLRYMASGMS